TGPCPGASGCDRVCVPDRLARRGAHQRPADGQPFPLSTYREPPFERQAKFRPAADWLDPAAADGCSASLCHWCRDIGLCAMGPRELGVAARLAASRIDSFAAITAGPVDCRPMSCRRPVFALLVLLSCTSVLHAQIATDGRLGAKQTLAGPNFSIPA